MSFAPLTTERLVVRRFGAHDIARWVEYRNDEHTVAMQGWPVPFTTAQAEAQVEALSGDEPGTPGEWFQFAIADHESDRLLGDVGLYAPERNADRWTIGYTLHPDARGHGYAAEAVAAVLDDTHRRLGATHVHASTLTDNVASLRVMHRLGFVATGTVETIDGTDDPVFVHSAAASRPAQRIGLLTGGKSTRMGQDKATTLVGEQTMVERVAEACAATGLPTVVLGPDDAGTGLRNLRDGPGVTPGPLAGLMTLLADDPSHEVILLATDQPFVRPATILQLAMQPAADIVVPIDDGHPQVTCARYGPGVLYALQRGVGVRRLRDLFDLARTHRVEPEQWAIWGEDGRSFRSIDRPDEIDTALADYSVAPGSGDEVDPGPVRDGRRATDP